MDHDKSAEDRAVELENHDVQPKLERSVLVDTYPRDEIYEHEQDLKFPARANALFHKRGGGYGSQIAYLKLNQKHVFIPDPYPGENFPTWPGGEQKAGSTVFYKEKLFE